MFLCPDEQSVTGCGVGGEGALFEIIPGQRLEMPACLDDGAEAVFVLKIDLAIGVKRRCGVAAAETLRPVNAAGAAVEATGYAVVGYEVELLANQERRRRVRRRTVRPPCHMGFGHVALAVRPDGQQARRLVARADEEQSLPVHRARDNGVAVIADAPDFLAARRIVGVHGVAGWADNLLPAVHGNEEWRAEREALGGIDAALRLPAHAPGGGV